MAEGETAYVAVGSNIDPEANLVRALALLAERVRVTGLSTVYRTAALGGRREQPDYLNTAWRVEAPMGARALKFEILRPIEADLGRVRTADKYAARPIDLDVVLCGDTVVDERDLRLPDPDVRTRAFLAAGLLELDPELVLPDDGERLADLFSSATLAALTRAAEITEALRRSLRHE
jgi:2-amino-4-hydroxy-6-hydroxymethyldihydropteridine diphosphokinase